jgi:hypothetical protein
LCLRRGNHGDGLRLGGVNNAMTPAAIPLAAASQPRTAMF